MFQLFKLTKNGTIDNHRYIKGELLEDEMIHITMSVRPSAGLHINVSLPMNKNELEKLIGHLLTEHARMT